MKKNKMQSNNNLIMGIYDTFVESFYNFNFKYSYRHQFVELTSSTSLPVTYSDNNNNEFLIDFLGFQNEFPIYLTFIPTPFESYEYERELKPLGLSYTKFNESGNNENSYFLVQLRNSSDLFKVKDLIYSLTECNQFVGFSFDKSFNITLKNGFPCLKMPQYSPFITFSHDAQGILILSIENQWLEPEYLIKKLPNKSLISEIIVWHYDGNCYIEI
ncbi:hypothetical protein ACSVDA_20925 [Cytobacillus sp. Hm23]